MSTLRAAHPFIWLPTDMALFRRGSRPIPHELPVVGSASEARDPERESANAAMERYARGEDQAFPQLYDLLAPRLHRYLLRATRDPTRADDLLQQTMLRIHSARGRFIVGAEVLPWAFAIARRLWIDSVRRRKGESRSVSFETGGREASPMEIAADARSADEVLDAKRLGNAIEFEIERLPESHRVAFELVQKDGLSIREAAEVLGVTPGAVKLRTHRAYLALRLALANVNDHR